MDNILKCGLCGIIEGELSERIFKSNNKAVGFYYSSELNGVQSVIVFLYYCHNAKPIEWIPSYLPIDILLTYPYIDKLRCYPLNIVEPKTGSIQIISRSDLNIRKNNVSFFRSTILSIYEKQEYNAFTSGYELINRVILDMDGNISPCPTDTLVTSSILKLPIELIIGPIDQSLVESIDNKLNDKFNPLRDYIINLFNKETKAIDLKQLVDIYNNLDNSFPIKITEIPSRTISILGSVTLPTDSHPKFITAINSNLSSLTRVELLDLLVYINSLDNDKYTGLQNEIIYLLATIKQR